MYFYMIYLACKLNKGVRTMDTINRDAEIFKVIKQGLLDFKTAKAIELADDDSEAQVEYDRQEKLNDDVGGGHEFDELRECVQTRLFEEAADNIVESLEEVLPDNNACLVVLTKILRGLV